MTGGAFKRLNKDRSLGPEVTKRGRPSDIPIKTDQPRIEVRGYPQPPGKGIRQLGMDIKRKRIWTKNQQSLQYKGV